jgi:hypothetical protein
MTTIRQIQSQFSWTIVSLALLLAITSAANAQRNEQLAQQSAESWLALVDTGKYADSWQEASAMFKAHVTRDQWQSMVKPVREPLGKLTSRKLKSASYTKALPGAPDGEYVVIQFDSSFEHKQAAVETITPTLDKDGKWRVSGYFIK